MMNMGGRDPVMGIPFTAIKDSIKNLLTPGEISPGIFLIPNRKQELNKILNWLIFRIVEANCHLRTKQSWYPNTTINC